LSFANNAAATSTGRPRYLRQGFDGTVGHFGNAQFGFYSEFKKIPRVLRRTV